MPSTLPLLRSLHQTGVKTSPRCDEVLIPFYVVLEFASPIREVGWESAQGTLLGVLGHACLFDCADFQCVPPHSAGTLLGWHSPSKSSQFVIIAYSGPSFKRDAL